MKLRWFWIFFLLSPLFSVGLAAPDSSPAPKILVPRNKSIVQLPAVDIVAVVPETGTWHINIGKTAAQILRREPGANGDVLVHARTVRDMPGAFVVTVTSPTSDLRAQANVFRRDNLTVQIPAGYSAWDFHAPAAQRAAGCAAAGCHTFASAAKSETSGAACLSCHSFGGQFRRHAPVKVGACFQCHSETGTPAFRVTQSMPELCVQCHKDVGSPMHDSWYIHGPANRKDCGLCHDAHGDGAQSTTWRGRDGTCLTCHSGIDKKPHVVSGFGIGSKEPMGHPLAGVPDIMDPQDVMHCGSCHSPHFSQSHDNFNFGVYDRWKLCQVCHGDKFN